MTIERDGTWDPVGSKLRDALRDVYKLHGEECVYVDMASLKNHRPTDWDDHAAIHALYALAHGRYEQLPAFPYQLSDMPTLREAIRHEFVVNSPRMYHEAFEDERDDWGDRHAIVALKGINSFVSAQMSGGLLE